MMRRVFAENENNDIYLASNNQMAVNLDLDATLQACQAAVEIMTGEAIYSQARGMPNFETIWAGTPNLQQFEFFARKQIRGVIDVVKILDFTAIQKDDTLQYSTTIKTIYGTGAINGSV